MKKCFLVASANLRRAKGQTVAIVALILFASAMLNLWLMLSVDYKRNFDRYHDKLNAEHVTMELYGRDDELRDFIAETLDKDERITQYSIEDAMCIWSPLST